MLPSLAPLLELKYRIPGGIATEDEPRAEAALADASALVRDEAGKTWMTDGELDADIPDRIVSITLAAAKRAYVNPDGVRSESIDGYSTDYSTASPDVYLTSAEKRAIKRAVGSGGVWTLSTTRSDSELSTTYLDVDPPGEPIPWGASPDPF